MVLNNSKENLEEMHAKGPDTKDLSVNDNGGVLKFNDRFVHL